MSANTNRLSLQLTPNIDPCMKIGFTNLYMDKTRLKPIDKNCQTSYQELTGMQENINCVKHSILSSEHNSYIG